MNKLKYLIDSPTRKTNFNYIFISGELSGQWVHYANEPIHTDTEESSIRIPNRSYKDEALLLLSLGLGKQEIEEHFNIGK